MAIVAVAEQPFAAVTVTVYIPCVDTVSIAFVEPSSQTYIAPVCAVRSIASGAQPNTVMPPVVVIDAVGFCNKVTPKDVQKAVKASRAKRAR